MATSKLQIEVGDLLDRTFPEYRIRENYRPEWLRSSNLTKLELDFYIEELKIAFEIQGAQHYKYIPYFFKTPEDFEKQKQYDQEKKDLCYGAGIKLIEIDSLFDAKLEIGKLCKKKITIEDLYNELEIRGLSAREPIIKRMTDNPKSSPKKVKPSPPIAPKIDYKELYLQDPVHTLIQSIRKHIVFLPESANLKVMEIRGFCKKLENFYKNGGKANQKIFHFDFKHLGNDEREVLLEGLRYVQIKYDDNHD